MNALEKLELREGAVEIVGRRFPHLSRESLKKIVALLEEETSEDLHSLLGWGNFEYTVKSTKAFFGFLNSRDRSVGKRWR